MKYLKMLGLAAVAAMALMAFAGAGTASAATSTLCSAAQSPCSAANKWPLGTVLDFSLKSGTSAKLVTTDGETTLDSCSGSGTTVKGKLEKDSTSSPAVLAQGPVEVLKWETCSVPTNTIKLGGLSVEGKAGGNGTVRSTGEFQVTINTILFGKCVFGVTAGTDLGEIKEGKPATFVANAVASKIVTAEHSGVACPETALWTAEYTLTEPSNTTLYVSAS